jgi:hypothetical protein
MTASAFARPILSRRLLLAAAGAAALPLPAFAQGVGAEDRLIMPGTRIGAVRKGSTWATLIGVYTPQHMRRDKIPIAEGDTASGARIFPGTPAELQVAFESDNGPVDFIRVLGRESPWRTAEGLRIGTTLAELEKMNGGPFRLYGFAWDHGGALDRDSFKKLPKGLWITVEPREQRKVSEREFRQVMGDKTIASSHPTLKKIDVRVSSLVLSFAK